LLLRIIIFREISTCEMVDELIWVMELIVPIHAATLCVFCTI